MNLFLKLAHIHKHTKEICAFRGASGWVAAALAVADGAADAAAGDAAEDDGPPDDAGSSSDRDDEGDGGGVALDTAVKAGVVRIAAASKKVG